MARSPALLSTWLSHELRVGFRTHCNSCAAKQHIKPPILLLLASRAALELCCSHQLLSPSVWHAGLYFVIQDSANLMVLCAVNVNCWRLFLILEVLTLEVLYLESLESLAWFWKWVEAQEKSMWKEEPLWAIGLMHRASALTPTAAFQLHSYFPLSLREQSGFLFGYWQFQKLQWEFSRHGLFKEECCFSGVHLCYTFRATLPVYGFLGGNQIKEHACDSTLLSLQWTPKNQTLVKPILSGKHESSAKCWR